MKTGIKKIALFLVAAGLLLASSVSFAGAPERNPILKQFEAKGGKVEFLGHVYGMDGWVVTSEKGGIQYVYTMPDGALLLGMLFAPDGTLETMKQVKAFKERADGSQAAIPGAEQSSLKSEQLYTETEKASWVALGSSTAPYLYVFMNVNCDHCQEFLKDIDASVKAGSLQVRLVPYGTVELNRDSAAALLSVAHPDEAWQAYMAGDKAVLGKDKIGEAGYLKVDANTALAQKWKLPGPPFTLYRRPADGVVTAVVGRPENKMLLPAEFLK